MARFTSQPPKPARYDSMRARIRAMALASPTRRPSRRCSSDSLGMAWSDRSAREHGDLVEAAVLGELAFVASNRTKPSS